ncbi:DnaB-like helicase C-terminal domain-containing protein [Bifidobacterium dentium]|uniref:DnaB-like helicase C-terminal domain-containing protein n=1 Tax=Bifidobacterium dentium TaxID=1689 RepID=UPI0028EA3ECC|nr:DnaB-like helicase C-terminal domain-containing protein [Bifidobacterium dentium]
MARHAAAASASSCFFCPDKSAIEIGRRIMSAETGVPMETLFSGNDLDGEEAALCDAAYSLCERMPLYIKAGQPMDANCIVETCRGLKKTSGLKLVVADGLPSIVDHVDDEPRILKLSKLV